MRDEDTTRRSESQEVSTSTSRKTTGLARGSHGISTSEMITLTYTRRESCLLSTAEPLLIMVSLEESWTELRAKADTVEATIVEVINEREGWITDGLMGLADVWVSERFQWTGLGDDRVCSWCQYHFFYL